MEYGAAYLKFLMDKEFSIKEFDEFKHMITESKQTELKASVTQHF